MTSEAGRFCPPTLALALPYEHWYTRFLEKPLPIRYTVSQTCKLRTSSRDRQGCSWPLEQPAASGNCTFSGIVPIALQRFKQSGVSVVECPGCGRVWTLSPGGGVLRFKAHPGRKTNTPATSRRWERRERRNGLGCSRRVHFTYAPDFRKASRAEV